MHPMHTVSILRDRIIHDPPYVSTELHAATLSNWLHPCWSGSNVNTYLESTWKPAFRPLQSLHHGHIRTLTHTLPTLLRPLLPFNPPA